MARVPIGIELIKRNVATEANIKEALRYQKTHPDKKLGDILNILNLCDRTKLINAMGEILGEKVILISPEYVKINVTNYISIDIVDKLKDWDQDYISKFKFIGECKKFPNLKNKKNKKKNILYIIKKEGKLYFAILFDENKKIKKKNFEEPSKINIKIKVSSKYSIEKFCK